MLERTEALAEAGVLRRIAGLALESPQSLVELVHLGSVRHHGAEVDRAGDRVLGESSLAVREVGDTDPVQAIEDALRTFPADEVLVVTRPDDDESWLEQDSAVEARERFGVPVTRLTV